MAGEAFGGCADGGGFDWSTQTTARLVVVCVRDDAEYELARKVSDEDFAAINIERIGAFEAWNYRISPNINGQVIS